MILLLVAFCRTHSTATRYQKLGDDGGSAGIFHTLEHFRGQGLLAHVLSNTHKSSMYEILSKS
jgi:hypothetical protein